MITEDCVNFETAKLLKEKGYWNIATTLYKENGDIVNYNVPLNNKGFSSTLGVFYEAPTLQMAMKWLREEYKIHIQIWILEEDGYWFNIEKILNAQYRHKSLYASGLEDIYFDTYEQACEAAIKYCLENLI